MEEHKARNKNKEIEAKLVPEDEINYKNPDLCIDSDEDLLIQAMKQTDNDMKKIHSTYIKSLAG